VKLNFCVSFQNNFNTIITSSHLLLIEGKLTSLEEFRIQKDLFENQIKEANESLKKKRPGIARTSGADGEADCSTN
jgi:hypothetical protein